MTMMKTTAEEEEEQRTAREGGEDLRCGVVVWAMGKDRIRNSYSSSKNASGNNNCSNKCSRSLICGVVEIREHRHL